MSSSGQIRATEANPQVKADVIKGTLDMLILRTLSLEPMHAFGIGRRVEQISRGVFKVNPGSLLTALQRLGRPISAERAFAAAAMLAPNDPEALAAAAVVRADRGPGGRHEDVRPGRAGGGSHRPAPEERRASHARRPGRHLLRQP